MEPFRGTALITGASAGIGYELAKLFARDGHNLVLVARSAAALEQLAGELSEAHNVCALAIACDLTAVSAPRQIFDRLQSADLAVDFLINNAGYGIRGEFAQLPMEDCLGQIQLNITALTELTRLFLPGMLTRRRGRIMNVASTAAFQAGPLMSVYYASKAYVLSFSEALANEVKGSGLTVTCLCPGPTDTLFQKRAGTEASKLFNLLPPMDAATVAEQGYRALMQGKTLAISGVRNWLLAQSVRLAPRKLVTEISRKVLETSKR